MKVITPSAVAKHTDSKYLGVLVAAKYARSLNEFRRGQFLEDDAVVTEEPREKLTTIALEAVAKGEIDFQLVRRRRDEI